MELLLRNGKTLRIKPVVKADAAEIIAYMNRVGGESDNLSFGLNECRFTVEGEEAFIENAAEQLNCLMLVGRVDGEIVSLTNLGGNPRVRMAHNATLGITVRGDHWRQGIGEAMLHAAIDWARASGILRVIHLTARSDNARAIALYEKLGFEHVGVFREEMCIDGTYFDSVAMDLHLC